MALEDDISLLANVAMFRDFPEEQLRLLAFGTEREYLPGGRILFSQGEEADGGYVVAAGQIDLVATRGGQECIVQSCLEGALIGEMALITRNRRVASAVARTNAEVLRIPRSLFHRMLSAYPDTAASLADQIGQSVRRMMFQIEKVGDRMAAIGNLSAPSVGRADPDQE